MIGCNYLTTMDFSIPFPGEPKPLDHRLWQAEVSEHSSHEFSDEDQS